MKTESERLGMHIKGGLNGQRGNPLDGADEGVFVSKINSSGAARRDGRLKVKKNRKSQKPICVNSPASKLSQFIFCCCFRNEKQKLH